MWLRRSSETRQPPSLAAKLTGNTLCATFVIVAELTQWAEMHRWGVRRKLALTQWLASVDPQSTVDML